MAITFPSNPTNGQVHAGYYYDDNKGAWRSLPLEQTQSISSATPPLTANPGEFWYNTNDGTLLTYFNDGTSSQWVEVKANSTLNSTIPTRLDSLETSRTSMLATDTSLLSRADSLETFRSSVVAGTQNIPGSIVQVLSKTDTSAYASGVSATTWYTWPGSRLALTITPKFNTSKVLIIVNVALGNASNDAAFRITRGGSPISIGDAAGSRPRATGITGMLYAADTNHTNRMVTTSFLDSPATTSATTYNVDYMSEGTTMYLNRVASYPDANTTYAATVTSTITLMEVAQ